MKKFLTIAALVLSVSFGALAPTQSAQAAAAGSYAVVDDIGGDAESSFYTAGRRVFGIILLVVGLVLCFKFGVSSLGMIGGVLVGGGLAANYDEIRTAIGWTAGATVTVAQGTTNFMRSDAYQISTDEDGRQMVVLQ